MRNTSALPLAFPEPSRAPRSAIREERLRVAADLKRPGALTAWRGRSGRRYVMNVYPLVGGGLPALDEGVAVAVRRLGNGAARVVGLAASEPGQSPRARLRWLALSRRRGATELHLHLLAEGASARRAILRDLGSA